MVVALNIDDETFIVDIMTLVKPTIILIYLSHKAQVTLLISMEISAKYFYFSDIFSLDSLV